MEPVKQIIKEFHCRKHPREAIQRISSIESANSLYCIECVLAIEDKQTKEAVLPIKDFIQYAVAHFQMTLQQKGNPPEDVLAVLGGEDEIIAKISAHIEAEKFKVEISFGEIIQTFSTLCSKAKHELLNNLDTQLFNFRNNYRYYKEKINKYYEAGTEKASSPFKTESGMVSAINKCGTAAELEVLVNQIKGEMFENKFLSSLDDKTGGMNNILKELRNYIKAQGELLPKTLFSDPMKLQSITEKLEKTLSDFVNEISSIENEFVPFTSRDSRPPMDSMIVKDPSEVDMIRSWLSSHPSLIKFKLLVRGTRDGFDAVTFHNRCDNKQNTLVLVKTEHDRRCGGFTEVEWNPMENYKQQNNSFLFSIDHKTKFDIMAAKCQWSMCGNSSYLPTFGGGHDLHLANNCNLNQFSYSKFGHSYAAGKFAGKNMRETLTGKEHFKVLEYEVFEVEGYKLKQ